MKDDKEDEIKAVMKLSFPEEDNNKISLPENQEILFKISNINLGPDDQVNFPKEIISTSPKEEPLEKINEKESSEIVENKEIIIEKEPEKKEEINLEVKKIIDDENKNNEEEAQKENNEEIKKSEEKIEDNLDNNEIEEKKEIMIKHQKDNFIKLILSQKNIYHLENMISLIFCI